MISPLPPGLAAAHTERLQVFVERLVRQNCVPARVVEKVGEEADGIGAVSHPNQRELRLASQLSLLSLLEDAHLVSLLRCVYYNKKMD